MHSFPIYYDDSRPIEDVVSIAVAPIDAFTGQISARPVNVTVKDIDVAPRQNLSGLRVFVNLPARPDYKINIEAQAAGYFNPPETTFPPAPPTGNEPRIDIYLRRRPEFPFDPDTTLVRGQLVTNVRDPVPDALVRADLPTVPGGTPPFETQTDQKGSFALPLRMPPDLLPTDLVTFTFTGGGFNRNFQKPVREGVLNTFQARIRMDGGNTPDLLAFVGDPVP